MNPKDDIKPQRITWIEPPGARDVKPDWYLKACFAMGLAWMLMISIALGMGLVVMLRWICR